MRYLILVSILGLSACAGMSGVPESEMQRSYGKSGQDDFSRRGY